MKARRAVAAAVAACFSTLAAAQMGPGADHRGMGPGMMGGQGMGPGMMGGHDPAALERLGLNDEQRVKVRDIQRDMQRKHHALMGSMRDLRWQAEDNARSATFDEAAARKNYDAMAALRKQLFEARLDAHKRMEAVLTKEQREQLRKGAGPAGPGPR